MYATFEFYRDQYFGTLIPEDDFTRIERKARAWVDRLTFFRIDEEWAGRAEVKMACCAVAEALFGAVDEAGREKQAISSERLDQYQITYQQKSDISMQGLVRNAMMLYLAHTGLMSRAVRYRTGGVRQT